MELTGAVIYRRASGLAADLAEARSHRRAGRRHDAPGAGGGTAEVLEEVRRRLAVGPELTELVAEAVEEALAGRRPRWSRPRRSAGRIWSRRPRQLPELLGLSSQISGL